MYKLLIVDDEPLVQVGIRSMVNWRELNIEVCGTALNGQAALGLIETTLPDIVITDIKMPVMSGLELIRICRETYGNTQPDFIILTSYEDFHMAKEALTYQVSDYLIKLELTPENLKEAISTVIARLEKNRTSAVSNMDFHLFYDKFFIRILHNLFESEEQFILQSKDLHLDFHYSGYICCYGEILSTQADSLPMEKQLSLFSVSLQMIRELAEKYAPCYAISLDIRHFALLFCCDSASANCAVSSPVNLKTILTTINITLEKYYNVSLQIGIGNLVSSPFTICDSYQYSRKAFHCTKKDSPIMLYEDCIESDSPHNSFNISLFKNDLTKAFEEYDADALKTTVDTICELFTQHPNHYVQAMDAASNILYLSISLLQNGESIVSEFFKDNPEGYRSLYKQTNVDQIIAWLTGFSDCLCRLFENHHKDYKNHIVINVKKYINEHTREHLSLNEVAAVFGISPNYLSQLFGKYSDTGFNEYINLCKIKEAKRLLCEDTLKVYEVAEILGFESSFYFSKVFKKLEGVAPTDYINGNFSKN